MGMGIESVEPIHIDERPYAYSAQAAFVSAQEEEILPRYGDGPRSSVGVAASTESW